MGWKGAPADYGAIQAGVAGGGGDVPSRVGPAGMFRAIVAGMAGGGGRVPSTAEPQAGAGGCGGPGPGAMIGLDRR